MKAALTIRRSQTGLDVRSERFSLELAEEATLLDALDAIKDEHDDSLTFRACCGTGGCGSCGMRVDGRSVLACETPLAPLVADGREPVVAPLGNLPVVRDLVVDLEPFWAKHRAIDPFAQVAAGDVAEGAAPPEAACVLCGVCVSECVSLEQDPDFLGPAALAIAHRHVADPREDEAARAGRVRNVSGEHGARACVTCGLCNERCPKGVEPLWSIAELRSLGPRQPVLAVAAAGLGGRARGLLARAGRRSDPPLLVSLRDQGNDDE